MRLALVLLILLLGLPAMAEDVPLPKPRPAELEQPQVTPPRPRPEPPASQPEQPPAPETTETPATPEPPPVESGVPAAGDDAHVPAPEAPPAPPRVYQTACPAVLQGQVEAEALPPLNEGQCGTQSPLSLTGVLANGRMVPVSGGVVTDCGMATALPGWVATIDSYAVARENTRVSEVIVGTSYMCRNVNNGAEGNLSFHAFADALDIVGFKLEDGRTVTVESGWADALSPEGRLLRFAHGAACAGFTTVLGPEANALHRDHLHLDLGCHGKSCTARICE